MPDANLTTKVYLDTCILSKLRAGTVKEEQLNALDKISDYENVIFVTSEKMLYEFLQTTESRIRITLKILYKLIAKIPSKPFFRIEGGFSFPLKFPINFGTKVENELFTELKAIFPHLDDVEHIYQAAAGDCEYFMTLDEKSILKKARKFSARLSNVCPNLVFVDPVALINKLLEFPA